MIKYMLVGLLFCGGCITDVDEKINTVRQIKYAADDAFVGCYEGLLHATQKLAVQKFDLQEKAINTAWDAYAVGNPTTNLASPEFKKNLAARDAAFDDLRKARTQMDTIASVTERTIAAYKEANIATYKTEEDAYEAQKKFKATLTTSLEAIGAVAGGFASSFLVK